MPISLRFATAIAAAVGLLPHVAHAGTAVAWLSAVVGAGAGDGGADAGGDPFPPPEFELKLLDKAKYPEARCLDGTQGGYYVRQGSGEGRAKFKIHLCGGGWCTSEASCAGRAKSNLGSSSFWPPVANTNQSGYPGQWNLGLYGVLGNDTKNTFADWTSVFVMYCDGSSMSSYRAEPLNGIYYRGRSILDGVVTELLDTEGMRAATDVILTGTSAGGMGTYAHAQLFRDSVAKGARVAAVPDAGFWLDAVDLQGQRKMRQSVQDGVVLWNTSAHGPGNEACLARYAPANETWKCYLAQYVLPFVGVPVMVVNSLYDPAQYGIVLGLTPSDLSKCSAKELEEAEAYRGLFQQSILSALRPSDGAFLTACNQHEETCRQPDWEGITVGGVTMMGAVTAWYGDVVVSGNVNVVGNSVVAGGSGANHTHVDCGPWGPHPFSCNPTCVKLNHGAC